MESHRHATSAHPEISGFVLAGGRSSRLGRDKVLLPWRGQTLLAHAVARLQQICQTVYVCGNRPDLREHLPQSVPMVPDAHDDAGPLGGIVPALEISHHAWNLFLAVDLPLVPVEILSRLIAVIIDRHATSPHIKCILPTAEKRPQPLCALYHKSLERPMRRALDEGNYKVLDAVQYASRFEDTSQPVVCYVEMETLPLGQRSSPGIVSDWFLNINTVEDLRRVKDFESSADFDSI